MHSFHGCRTCSQQDHRLHSFFIVVAYLLTTGRLFALLFHSRCIHAHQKTVSCTAFQSCCTCSPREGCLHCFFTVVAPVHHMMVVCTAYSQLLLHLLTTLRLFALLFRRCRTCSPHDDSLHCFFIVVATFFPQDGCVHCFFAVVAP